MNGTKKKLLIIYNMIMIKRKKKNIKYMNIYFLDIFLFLYWLQ